MRHRPYLIIAWIASAAVAAAFAVIRLVAGTEARWDGALIPVVSVLAPVAVATAVFAMRRTSKLRGTALAALPPVLLTVAGLAAFLVAEGDVRRTFVAVIATAFVSLYLSYWRGMESDDVRYRPDDFGHLSFALGVLAVFFAFAGLFGVSAYAGLPTPVFALVIGLLTLGTVAPTLRHSHVPRGAVLPLAGTLAVIMAEAALALPRLPTTGLSNAAVGVVLYAGMLRAAVVTGAAGHHPPPLRRQIAFSAAVIALVLSTARWA